MHSPLFVLICVITVLNGLFWLLGIVADVLQRAWTEE